MAGTSPSLVTAKQLESNLRTENQQLFTQKTTSSKYIHTYTNEANTLQAIHQSYII